MNGLKSAWNFVTIEKKHKRSEFDCGYPELNRYLARYARQNHLTGVNKAFVATKSTTPGKIDGYYTISSSIINFASFPELERKKIPNYPIPAARTRSRPSRREARRSARACCIGRLAVDINCQGQGLGKELLVNALKRIIKASQELGIYAVRVDPIDERAKRFYLKYEFIPFTDCSLSLFLPLRSIAEELN